MFPRRGLVDPFPPRRVIDHVHAKGIGRFIPANGIGRYVHAKAIGRYVHAKGIGRYIPAKEMGEGGVGPIRVRPVPDRRQASLSFWLNCGGAGVRAGGDSVWGAHREPIRDTAQGYTNINNRISETTYTPLPSICSDPTRSLHPPGSRAEPAKV